MSEKSVTRVVQGPLGRYRVTVKESGEVLLVDAKRDWAYAFPYEFNLDRAPDTLKSLAHETGESTSKMVATIKHWREFAKEQWRV